jgi:hypothetical protein
MISMTITSRSSAELFHRLVEVDPDLGNGSEWTPDGGSEKKFTRRDRNAQVYVEKCESGMILAGIHSDDRESEWLVLSSFTRFLNVNFKNEIRGISIAF